MSLRVLQFSDIHFSTKHDDKFIFHRDVRKQVLHDLKDHLLPNIDIVHSVLIAGDIAFSGKREEYLDAAEWLEQVTSTCGCDRTAVLMVPGNHDVNFDRIQHTTRMLHRRLRTCSLREATSELVELAQTNDASLSDKLVDYQEFASIYRSHFERASCPIWNRRFSLDEKCTVNFRGLTTVQVSDNDDEKGALLLGPHQYVIDNEPSIEEIVVMHHPWEWFKDRRDAEQYLSRSARVLVFGHEHIQKVFKIEDASGQRLVIGSGAVTPEDATDPYIYRYNMLEFSVVDRDEGTYLVVTVFPRVWTGRKRFEADTVDGQPSEEFKLLCPHFRAQATVTRTASADATIPAGGFVKMTENDAGPIAHLSYFFWRYLAWQDRLKVLVQADVLPETHKKLPQNVEYLALERAEKDGKLAVIWDLVMPFVPKDKREANPFPKI